MYFIFKKLKEMFNISTEMEVIKDAQIKILDMKITMSEIENALGVNNGRWDIDKWIWRYSKRNTQREAKGGIDWCKRAVSEQNQAAEDLHNCSL